MLAKGNVAVPESVAIIEYMDKELSSGALLKNQPEDVKQRYEKFKELHEEFDVEGYSFGHICNAVWYLRQFNMTSFLDGAEHLIELVKSNKYPDKNEILIDKIFFYDTMFLDILMTSPDRMYNARINALKLLDMMSNMITHDE